MIEFWTPQAWVGGRWAKNLRMRVGVDGNWASFEADIAQHALSPTTTQLGPVLPGVVNAHSHAFQRAIAGLSERAHSGADDFWGWRARMYQAALRITPDQLEAIATQLYTELLVGGYTQVCEFHYLHNDLDGKPYANPSEMSMALVRAAQASGIGLTLLPVVYMHSGFAVQRTGGGLKPDQRRFASTPESAARIAQAVNDMRLPRINAGIALHSLRAVDPAALTETAQIAAQNRWPVHIHIAEQTQEIDDCLAHHGQRPVAWLLDHAGVTAQWSLVHATHTTPDELAGAKASGATVVLCPSTEANLGDGVFDLPTNLQLGASMAIGSDSHVTRGLSEELRLLEYSQRLTRRQRNVASMGQGSSAAALFQAAVTGGSTCACANLGGLAVGQRADFVTLNPQAPALLGMPNDHLLDAWIFSSPDSGCKQAHVAGQAVHGPSDESRTKMLAAMSQLWGY